MQSSGRLCTGRLHPLLFVLFLLLIARDSAGGRAKKSRNSRNSMNSKVPGGRDRAVPGVMPQRAYSGLNIAPMSRAPCSTRTTSIPSSSGT
jgi:hypothetical protein